MAIDCKILKFVNEHLEFSIRVGGNTNFVASSRRENRGGRAPVAIVILSS